MKRRTVTIWRGWGLKGPIAEQVEVAKAARRRGLTRNDGQRVRALAADMRKGSRK